MTEQSIKDKPKASSLLHQPKPVFASQKLAGFADKAVFVDSSQSQTRDGFSFDVLGKSVLQSAYSANIPEQMYRTPNRQHNHPETSDRHPELVSGSTSNGRNAAGTEIGTRYRYIDDTPLVPLSEAAAGGSSSAAAGGARTRSRASSEYVLYSHGTPAAVNSDEGTSYFGTDILGSVRNVTDKYGAVQSSYDYDVFGSPYLGNLDNDMSFGYTGKAYDAGTGLYDYGFRDYSPVSARFTTVDPIRDGSNWFSYVVNDPVNYVDPFGLSSTDRSGWSNVKNTIKGWIDSAKSDLIQTWNDIKGVVSTTISDTKAAVSAVVANVGKSITAWTTQAKAAVNKTLSDFSVVGNNIKEAFFGAVVWTGVNMLGGESTKKIFNAELKGEFHGLPTENGNDYGVSKNLKNEIRDTYLQKSENKFIEKLVTDLAGTDSIIDRKYGVEVKKSPGISDMETAIGKYEATVLGISEKNGVTTVTIHAHDVFNFESQSDDEGRKGFNEFVTWLAREAGLGSARTTIDVTFELKFRKEGNNYIYAE